MQTDNAAQHSSFVSLTPYECAIKYKNRDLLVRYGCATMDVVLTLVACWPYLLGEVGRTRLLVAIPIVLVVVAVELLLIIRGNADFQGIVTNDCDPVKMLKVEDHLLGHIKWRSRRMQHLLIASQAAMLAGDVARSRQLLDATTATGRLSATLKPMASNIRIGYAILEKDWPQVRSLRDELATYLPKSRGALKAGIEMIMLFTDEALAAAEGDLQTAEKLLDKIDVTAKMPEQRASAAFRRAQLESLKGNDAAARPYYEQARNECGTCHFAYQAAEWLATH